MITEKDFKEMCNFTPSPPVAILSDEIYDMAKERFDLSEEDSFGVKFLSFNEGVFIKHSSIPKFKEP